MLIDSLTHIAVIWMLVVIYLTFHTVFTSTHFLHAHISACGTLMTSQMTQAVVHHPVTTTNSVKLSFTPVLWTGAHQPMYARLAMLTETTHLPSTGVCKKKDN